MYYRVLLQSSEAPEDDYRQGIDDLKKVRINLNSYAIAYCYDMLIMYEMKFF